jgi:hypothetical protein
MKDFAARYVTPLETVRPRGGRLIEGSSVKLQRRVRLFSYSSFAQWIRLEADPSILDFCERPARVGSNPETRLIDFWVRRADTQELIFVDAPQEAPSQLYGIPVRCVTAAELAAANLWIVNWSRMLPVVNATRALLPPRLLRSVVHHVRAAMSLGRLEHELSCGDPSLARGAIFEQLRTGGIRAPSLHTQPIGLHTLVELVS